MKKIYNKETYTGYNKFVIELLRRHKSIKETSGDECWNIVYKDLCNKVRSDLKLDRIITLGVHKKKEEFIVIVFDCPVDDKFYIAKRDDKGFYIEIE